MKMTYDEARQYIKEASKAGIRPGLSCMRELCRRLGNPQDDLKIIHIAGTNGKRFYGGVFKQYFWSKRLSDRTLCYRQRYFVMRNVFSMKDMDGVHYIDKDLLTELIGEVAEAAEAMVKDGMAASDHI